MTWWFLVVAWLVLHLGDVVQARRAEPDVDYSQLPRPRQEPWLPQVHHQQRSRRPSSRDDHLWQPLQMAQQRRTNLDREPWLPQVVQQSHSGLLDVSWAPEVQQEQQTQIKVVSTWPEQRPQEESCMIDFDDVPKKHIHPFLVRNDRNEFLYPDLEGGRKAVKLASNTTVLTSCPGSKNHLLWNERPYAPLTCRGSSLVMDGQPVTWTELGCRKKPKPDFKHERRCGRGARTHTIGWQVYPGVFIPQITICFYRRQETTVYAKHIIHGRNIDAKMVEPPRPSFKRGKMFSREVITRYTKKSQKTLFRNLLNTTKHLTAEGQHYLAKGHLAPDADFVLEAEQDATYYYANVVPQWQAVNNGNWKKLEAALRELAIKRNATLSVWTGTHGVLQLPDSFSNPVRLYLGLARGKEVLPVPALMWKVIYDPSTSAAVAIVMVNDVRGLGTSDWSSLREPLCPDVCHRLPWVTWNTSDHRRGMTFCCTVDALRSTISELPSLGPAVRLLLR